MITFAEARQIAETEINNQQTLEDDSLIIISDHIIEKEYAWIFPYTSKIYWETNDINHALAGNGPLFISKLDGKVYTYRTGLSIEAMIDEYEEENKIWKLSLADNIFTDPHKTLSFRNISEFTIVALADFKRNGKTAFESGSKTRLFKIQQQLSLENIPTILGQNY